MILYIYIDIFFCFFSCLFFARIYLINLELANWGEEAVKAARVPEFQRCRRPTPEKLP